MIVGNADIDKLAKSAATIAHYFTEPVIFSSVTCFQMSVEMRNQARESVLPPALHPTIPAVLSLQFWRVQESPWGTFDLAVSRVACRSGVRARGFTTAAYTSNEQAQAALADHFGFSAQIAKFDFQQNYDATDLTIELGEQSILTIAALDPEPMSLSDVQYTGTLNLSHTPNGLRLVQLEAIHEATRVERLTSHLEIFEPAAWGNDLFDPYYVIASSIAHETVTFPPIRFVCKPDVLSFVGTEPAKDIEK